MRRQGGQQLMELALVMPVFIALVVGGIWLLLGLIYISSAGWAAQKAAEAGVAPGATQASVEAAASAYLGKTLLKGVTITHACAAPPDGELDVCVSVSGTQASVQIRGSISTGIPVNNGYLDINTTDVEAVHTAYCSSC